MTHFFHSTSKSTSSHKRAVRTPTIISADYQSEKVEGPERCLPLSLEEILVEVTHELSAYISLVIT